MMSDNNISLVSPTRICLLPRGRHCSGITVCLMHQYLGSNCWCGIANVSSWTSLAMFFIKGHSFHAGIHELQFVISVGYIVQRVWLQRLIYIHLGSQSLNLGHRFKSPHSSNKYMVFIGRKSWRVLTLSVGTVFPLAIISQRFLVNFLIPMCENNMATDVVHCLLAMQVGKFSTSVNSLPKRSKHFRTNIEWKHLLTTKVSSSKNVIRTMESLYQ